MLIMFHRLHDRGSGESDLGSGTEGLPKHQLTNLASWSENLRYYTGRLKKSLKIATFEVGGRIYVEFLGNISSFKKYWNFTGDVVGHHIIPEAQAFLDHKVIQKAAKSGGDNIFHPHHISNGYPSATSRYVGSHPNYSNQVFAELDRFGASPGFKNLASEEVADKIFEWQNAIRLSEQPFKHPVAL